VNLSSNHLVGKTTIHPGAQVFHMLNIGQLARAQEEIELARATVKMPRVNMNVCARNTTLQLRIVVFAKVRAV